MFDQLFEYPFLPFMIFLARISDVTIGTLRIIFVSKGLKKIAPLLGFFEVLIWIVVISEILSKANDWVCYIAYASGYATGNYIGMLIEERLAMGVFLIRVFTMKGGMELVKSLNKDDYGATCIKGQGAENDVDIIETVVDRKHMPYVERIITEFDPKAFFVIEDVRSTQRGIFRTKQASLFMKKPRLGK